MTAEQLPTLSELPQKSQQTSVKELHTILVQHEAKALESISNDLRVNGHAGLKPYQFWPEEMGLNHHGIANSKPHLKAWNTWLLQFGRRLGKGTNARQYIVSRVMMRDGSRMLIVNRARVFPGGYWWGLDEFTLVTLCCVLTIMAPMLFLLLH